MRKLTVFNSITLDGYFTGVGGDLSWAHRTGKDPEWENFVAENAGGGGTLVFGRITYELMVQYWPTPEASKNDPVVAERMNNLPKIVFSRSLKKAAWKNTRLVKDDLVTEMEKMKDEKGEGMVVLGSGRIVSQLAEAGLIDEYQSVIVPIVLGKGRTLFEGIEKKIPLKLTKSRTFKNGNVWLCHEPAASAG